MGTVEKGPNGWRASHAYPLALSVSTLSRRAYDIAAALEGYDVPVEVLDAGETFSAVYAVRHGADRHLDAARWVVPRRPRAAPRPPGDVAVHVVGADRRCTPSRSSTARTDGFSAGEAQRDPVGSRELVDLGQLRRALRVDEVHRLEVEDERAQRWLGRVHELADPVVERLRGGEEEPAVEPQHGDARERLVARVLVELAEDLRPGSRPSSGIAGAVAT